MKMSLSKNKYSILIANRGLSALKFLVSMKDFY